ncbi:MAG: LysM peptidoglycan-binding domain-containing protein, partial [Bacteroidota bacterium]|nr:LysM peptidoglycan-binding domain-containing protein [Bacteroidota bacterium]
MKKKNLIVLSLLFLFSVSLFAQNTEVKIIRSNNKVVIGGTAYYVHIVKKGETLYSLSKTYNISQKEIAKENPEIFLGLQINQALKIPVKPRLNEKVRYSKSNKFIYHKVKKKQTLYFLSGKYDVSQSEIIALNPGVEKGLDINQIVKIPKKQIIEQEEIFVKKENIIYSSDDTIKKYDSYIQHKVDSLETFYSLSKEFEVNKEDIISANPILEDGLKFGQIIRIPVQLTDSLNSIMLETDADTNIVSPYLNNNYYSYSDSIDYKCDTVLHSETFDIALFLPFYLNENRKTYSIDSTEFDEYGKRIYKRNYFRPYYLYSKSINFIELYEGILIAVDSLRNKGMSINLHVYDTKNNSTEINDILMQEIFNDVDLIIGPVFKNKLTLVSKFAKRNNINIVSPLTTNSEILNKNRNYFQVFPSFYAQINTLTDKIGKHKNDNIVLLHSGDSLQYAKNEYVKNRIISKIRKEKIDSNKILLLSDIIAKQDSFINNFQLKEVVYNDSISKIIHSLRKDKKNIIIIPSNDQALVSDVITKLNYISKTLGYDINLYGMNKWQRFTNIEPDYYYNLQLKIQTPFYINYNKKNINNFILKYRKRYKSEPSQFVFHGFDVAYYFLSALFTYGSDFNYCLNKYNIELLQTNYKYIKLYDDSGFENISGTILN